MFARTRLQVKFIIIIIIIIIIIRKWGYTR
jgi:hypothetical protein